jgi:hypothetical protein
MTVTSLSTKTQFCYNADSTLCLGKWLPRNELQRPCNAVKTLVQRGENDFESYRRRCLYSPVVEKISPLGQELLQLRDSFLSQLEFQTYSGYVASQFKKMQADIRNHGTVKWKHVMHLIRLLMSGITVLKERQVMVEVGEHRERLLAIKRGEVPFEETNQWRKELQREFEGAFERTKLPERPDYERINDFLIRARRLAVHAENTP